MSVNTHVQKILIETLQLDESTTFNEDDLLLGSIPEFDSMAVVTVITSIEETFDIYVEDDEISAETFESFGSLCAFVESKL
ncbi:acyl carrier protein [Flocculibacter collagenilyticus]|uniref:acyl carrier protein n=1 Tax=Flocculibacter collagenilyticus TaxID=2744479 RepID=UPI0018F31525|nr:acyl carrier protein [Flocculibacter collagenilyticus]